MVEAGLTPTSPEPRTHPDTSEQPTQPVRPAPRPSRNEPCPCGSGLKFKRCCLNKPRPSSERSSG
ncbi:MAG: SEC-C domain-containing protein [Bryobacterales bacterium]|nr:SEC-C domain-containing protein [Bryobacterales bacterium]